MEQRNIDWQLYSLLFPNRYLLPSKSDSIIKSALVGAGFENALDVGGGVYGTRYLWDAVSKTFLLDPYVHTSLPTIRWDELSDKTFDVIVARGSFNYLVPEEIKTLAKRFNGIFAFNTFIRPSEGERRYESKSGAGVEKFSLVSGGDFGMIEHSLKPDDEDWQMVHRFFYYPEHFICSILSRCDIVKYGNTAVYLVRP